MSTNSEYNIIYYSGFDKRFKNALKKINTLDTDFGTLLTVITGKLPLVHEDPRKLPNNPHVIAGLGSKVKFPIVKIGMHIKQMKGLRGRAIFLFDKSKKNIFFIDIYIKHKNENHNVKLIKKAHSEYLEIINNL